LPAAGQKYCRAILAGVSPFSIRFSPFSASNQAAEGSLEMPLFDPGQFCHSSRSCHKRSKLILRSIIFEELQHFLQPESPNQQLWR
jgi:hypothetical protein